MTTPQSRRFPIHRAWVIATACALMLFITMGMNLNVFSLYYPHMLRELNFTNAQVSWVGTMRSMMALVGFLTVHLLCVRLGLRRTVAVGLLLQILSRVICGVTSSFWAYCGASALAGLAYAWGGMVPLSLLIGRWFQGHIGFAVGYASAGSGLAIILLPAAQDAIIKSHGLHAAFLCEAALTVLLSALVLLLLRDSPAQVGLSPCHMGHDNTVPEASVHLAPEGMTHALLFMILLAAFIMGGPLVAGYGHISVLYTSSGYDTADVSRYLSYMGLILIFSKALCGAIADRLGCFRANFILGGTFVLAHILLCMAPMQSRTLPYLTMTLYALGAPLCSVSLATWARDLSGDNTYERYVRWLNTCYITGALVFGPLPGLLADRFHSYVPAFAIFTLASLLCIALAQIVYFRVGLTKAA